MYWRAADCSQSSNPAEMYTKQRRVFRNVGRRVPPRAYTPPDNLGEYLGALNLRPGGGGSPDWPYREFPGDKITGLSFEPNPVYPAAPTGETPPSDPVKPCVYLLGTGLPNGGFFDAKTAGGQWEYMAAVELLPDLFTARVYLTGFGGDVLIDTTILPQGEHVYLNFGGGIYNYHDTHSITGFQYGLHHQSAPPTNVVAVDDPAYKTPVLSVAGGGVAVTNWQIWVKIIGGVAAGTFTLHKKGPVGNGADASARVQMEIDCTYFPDPDHP